MDLQHWQAQFENWLKNHHQHQDAAHDVCHFRRVWATAQKLAADDDVDMLVILTACYFHDIVSRRKIIRKGSVLQSAAEETRRLLREEFEQFPAEKIEAVCHAIAAHSFSAQIAPLTTEAKIVQDADRLEAPGRLAWRACLPFQGHWAWRCLMVKIRSHSIARLMINATRWIISD
ncbi:HD domain-containing protein [Escherichia coli]|nr:HD domain-containing protein [Escherichia coli]